MNTSSTIETLTIPVSGMTCAGAAKTRPARAWAVRRWDGTEVARYVADDPAPPSAAEIIELAVAL